MGAEVFRTGAGVFRTGAEVVSKRAEVVSMGAGISSENVESVRGHCTANRGGLVGAISR